LIFPDSEDSDEDSAVQQLNNIESKMRDVFGGIARMDDSEEVRCHLEYCDRLAYLTQLPREAYVTADSGADTNVLCREWMIVSTAPVPFLNLVGFDAAHARTKGLSAVTADTIARTVDGNETILRAHQSLSNSSTSTTLLSEAQLRHAGHVVDSVHRDHLIAIDGSEGTKSLYLRQVDEEDGELV
jgi:hypothetical protein